MAALQHLPYLGTAEDDVLFVEWLVAVGEAVKTGQAIATVETLKAAFEVEAQHDGVMLRQLCEPGARVSVQAPIAVVGAVRESCDDAAVHALLQKPAAAVALEPVSMKVGPQPFAPAAVEPNSVGGSNAVGGTRAMRPVAMAPVAPAARRRAAELGVDLATVVGTGPEGFIRLADVERAVAAGPHACESPTQRASGPGALDAEFLAQVRRDAVAFGALASDFKLQLYRRHGAQIGEGSKLGNGSVLLAERIVLGERAFVGPECRIEAKELAAGPLLHFGARCRVRATRLQFGDNAFFADDLEIGGGGAMEPEAELVVGSHGFVGEHVHLNPCRTLRIGDEVVISRNAVVMTHSFGPSWLRGYPSRFAGVLIGDGAQIGISATLFPGVEVGAGAVILSGSSVVTSVPAGRLFGGVPATDMKAAAQTLTAAQTAERAVALVAEFARQLQLRGFLATLTSSPDRSVLVVARDDGEHQLEFSANASFAGSPASAERVLVAMDFPDEQFAAVPPNVTAIGLEPPRVRGPMGPLGAAFREFLRKRGCRLHPRTWAYTGGWL
ncbi:MAG: E3 binding domain-containing protein [Planctomycetes bacterium]|jgi:acetyltransferase-like isoleucine patch superfamily enzyme|nr:E3 binding domain-containing protein [Planctomycetota bacterium]